MRKREEQVFDLEADFFSSGAKVKKAQTNISRPGPINYSYDVTNSEVEIDRKPTERKETQKIEKEHPMDLVQKIIEEATKYEVESDIVLESVKNVQDEVNRNDPKIDAEKCELVTEGEKYDKLELRNRNVTETLSLVSDFGQDSQKAEEAHEDDDMRELLDHVSTTATRASSIAGSIFRSESSSRTR